MAKICGKWRIYLGIGWRVWDLWEMAQICGEMTYLFDKLLKNVENDLEIWEMAKIFEKWLRCMGHGLSPWETA